MSRVTILHRDLMQITPHDYYAPEGETLAAMVERVETLPEGWPRHEHDVICINGQPVPRGLWPMVKPRAVTPAGVPVEVTFHAPPMGGGGGGKNVLSVVATIGLLALSGGAAGAFGSFALGNLTRSVTTAALLGKLAGAAVLIGGSAILQALAPTPSGPKAREEQDGPKQLGSASAQGNILEPNAPLPRIVGTRKVFPPFVTEPLVYFDGEQEVVEVLTALAGPHDLSEIRVGDALIDDIQGVDFETRAGWPGYEPLSLLSRYGRTSQDGTPIRGHLVSEDDKQQVETLTGDILDALPPAKVIATRKAPDEFWIGIQFGRGLAITTDQNREIRVPLRLRIRRKGTTAWTNLPELHFQAAQFSTRRATIKLAWRDGPVNVSAASTQGWVEARTFSPGQAITPTTADWQADSYFDTNAGGDHYISAANAGASDVKNIIMGENEAEFQLDRATFPPDIYEVEIRRGYAFRDVDYASTTYRIGGSNRDPFWFEGSGAERIFQTKKNLLDELTLVRSSSVWNEAPVRKGGVSLIAVKARDTRIEKLSALASGYVRDWDGTDWTNWITTDDPAPHIRDVLTGLQNATPLPEKVVDDQSLVDFRAAGWSCNAILEGTSVSEAIKILAGSGFAQLYQSEKFGVIRDRDRSGDSPVQVFTPDNSAAFSWSRGYPKLPDGFRATFADIDADYEARQIIHPEGASRTEQVQIEGLVSEADVRTRMQYDLDTAKYRAAFYSWDAAAEAIKCRRGSLVGLVSDALSSRVFSGRVVDYDLDASGDVIAVQLTNEPELIGEPGWQGITDISTVQNVSLIGATFGLAIRRAGEVTTTHKVEESARGADWVDLVTPFALPGLDYGDIAAIGPLGKEYRRLLVIEMRPRSLYKWQITAVPEAPELWL